jgi:high-affinity iron transporter
MFRSVLWHRRADLIAAALVAVLAYGVLTLAGVTGAKSTNATPKTVTPIAEYEEQAPHVLSLLTVTGFQGGVSGASAEPPSGLPPLAPTAFSQPVRQYLRFAADELGLMEQQIPRLEQTLATDNRTGAESAWRTAYADYLRLGAVYLTGSIATLNQQINGNAGGLPGGVASPGFAGLHRIEYGLWTGAEPRGLLIWAERLKSDVHTLRETIGEVAITPLEYATRAHEILEDAIRDLLSGADVPWSGEGVLATDAGLEATEEVISTLQPLLKGREGAGQVVNAELPPLRSTIRALAAAHGGRLPSDNQLSQQEAESLDSAMGDALEALAQVPGALETEIPPETPQIPSHDVRIDP